MLRLSCHCLWATLTVLLFASGAQAEEKKLRALIVDGQNNHNWKKTTPVIRQQLELCKRFDVDIATSPPKRQDMSGFRPKFAEYDVVVSNYNGDRWSKQTEKDFIAYVKGGGGFVCLHAANNSFGDWPEYNEIIGLGGWGGRNEKHGPYVYFVDGKLVRDTKKGRGGSHGRQHPFIVQMLDNEHPITKGMPERWLHAKDELYDKLRGPAKNMTILATSFADPKQGGTGRDEPMMMVLEYGKGRVFHTPMGHADYSMKCVGFGATVQRGAEWAATGKVTIPLPKEFPGEDKVQSIE